MKIADFGLARDIYKDEKYVKLSDVSFLLHVLDLSLTCFPMDIIRHFAVQ